MPCYEACMAYEQEQRAALRILEGVEEGKMSSNDLLTLVEEADPALVYLLFTWLRKRYADHPNADAVIGRLLAVSDRGTVPELVKEGRADPVVAWFEDGYVYRDLDAKEFVELIVDKLES
jgi:phage terminase large subunit-like protein